LGEGYVGQAAKSKRLISITDVPENYLSLTVATGQIAIKHLVIVPFLHDEQLQGVIELGFIHDISESQLFFLKRVSASVGSILYSMPVKARNN
jgi:hypothetical protein